MSSNIAAKLIPTFIPLQARLLLQYFGTTVNSGTATLSNGEVDVAFPDLTTESIVFTSLEVPSGNVGVLSVQNKVAGEGFAISSSSSSDNSQVSWYVFEPVEV